MAISVRYASQRVMRTSWFSLIRSTGNWKRFLQWPRACPVNLYEQTVAVTRMRIYINLRRDYTMAEESNGPKIGSKIFDDDAAIEISRARQKNFLS